MVYRSMVHQARRDLFSCEQIQRGSLLLNTVIFIGRLILTHALVSLATNLLAHLWRTHLHTRPRGVGFPADSPAQDDNWKVRERGSQSNLQILWRFANLQMITESATGGLEIRIKQSTSRHLLPFKTACSNARLGMFHSARSKEWRKS